MKTGKLPGIETYMGKNNKQRLSNFMLITVHLLSMYSMPVELHVIVMQTVITHPYEMLDMEHALS